MEDGEANETARGNEPSVAIRILWRQQMDVTENFKRIMKGFVCGHCNTQSGYDIKFAQTEWDREVWPDFTPGKAFIVVQCHNCKLLSMFIFDMQSEQSPRTWHDDYELQKYIDENPDVVDYAWASDERLLCSTWTEFQGQYPSGRKLSSAVPDEIRHDLYEASNCLAVGSANAAVIMSRRVAERLASHFGAEPDKKKLLGATLNQLKDKHMISDAMFDVLFEIKEWGNISGHPKGDLLVSLREARKVVEFVFQVVDSIFPPPSTSVSNRLNELRNLRQKKD